MVPQSTGLVAGNPGMSSRLDGPQLVGQHTCSCKISREQYVQVYSREPGAPLCWPAGNRYFLLHLEETRTLHLLWKEMIHKAEEVLCRGRTQRVFPKPSSSFLQLYRSLPSEKLLPPLWPLLIQGFSILCSESDFSIAAALKYMSGCCILHRINQCCSIKWHDLWSCKRLLIIKYIWIHEVEMNTIIMNYFSDHKTGHLRLWHW